MEGKLRISLAFFVLLSVASQLKASTCYFSAQRLNANQYGSSYYLSSPNYPFNYCNNQDCSWYIAAPYSSMLIKLTFVDFYLQSSTSCSRDYIEIRDGRYSSSTFLSRYCGSKIPPTIISKGQYLYIKFHSNYMSTYRGFKLTYTAVYPGSTVVTIVGVLVAIALIVGIIICVVYYMKKNRSRGVVVRNSAPRSTVNTTTVSIATQQSQGVVIPPPQGPTTYGEPELYPQKGQQHPGPPLMGQPNPYPEPPPVGQPNPYPGPPPMGQPNPYPGPPPMVSVQLNPYPPLPQGEANLNPGPPPPGYPNSGGPPTVSI